MRVLLIGATGRLGAAVHDALRNRHEVITASRNDGDLTVDTTDPSTITAMYEDVGRVDAVASAFGKVPYVPLREITPDDLRRGIADKLLGQIELVRQGLEHVADDGSYTLITGGARSRVPAGKSHVSWVTPGPSTMVDGWLDSPRSHRPRSPPPRLPPSSRFVGSPTGSNGPRSGVPSTTGGPGPKWAKRSA